MKALSEYTLEELKKADKYEIAHLYINTPYGAIRLGDPKGDLVMERAEKEGILRRYEPIYIKKVSIFFDVGDWAETRIDRNW